MKVFIDTNVLLDVLAERKGFYSEAARLWTLSETGRLQGLVSVVSFVTCYYIIRKFAGRSRAEKAIRLLRDVFTPVELSNTILTQAIDSELPDFEDAIQYFSASHAGSEYVVTRNPAHFPRLPIPILSPSEFLAGFERPPKGAS